MAMPKRRDLIALAAPLALFAAKPGGLPNVTLNAKDVKIQKNPFGELRIYFDGPTDQLRAMTAGSLRLNAGATPHPPHTHPEEEFMVVTEGTGEMFCDGKTVAIGPGSMMYCAANVSHGIVNTGKKPLLFYFYKWKA
jgi:mannose-6-phosphate isomerase-like protein (cupin superfamily)